MHAALVTGYVTQGANLAFLGREVNKRRIETDRSLSTAGV
jgi:hypothetical protein